MQNPHIDDILQRLHALQNELEMEIDRLLKEKRQRFHYNLERGKVRFEQGIKALQKRQRTGLWHYLRTTPISHLLSAPLIYGVLIPFVFLDIVVTLYQQICFRIYHIPLVRRSDFLLLDRQYLAYLNAIEKVNCLYCSYSNGMIEYVREVAARTEQYWCPIKHARRSPDPHRLADCFVDYGDIEAYRTKLEKLRQQLADVSASRFTHDPNNHGEDETN
jgi:hypothetical protein